ncbi:helix-turn-helix transcriptional regulator [Streptomyces sp. NPDC047070]|uniref:helix-turn-helix transcriptional regulator n=1 Tax=Streptomyces sp. NPDC047070 TaxID=3154923 RepID=UPI0034522D64
MRRNNPESKRPDQAQIDAFGDWFEQRLVELGYDLSPRGGGRGQFARDAGVSPATVSRILLRQSIPDPRVLGTMHPQLKVSLGELLVRAGVATEDEIEKAAEPEPGTPTITPHEAARQLGITDGPAVDLFVSYTQQLMKQAQERRSQEGGRRKET